MRRFFNFMSSMKLTVILLSTFAIAIGVATFIESDFSTQTAQAEVYSANWFEILLGMLGLNLIFSMIKNSMFKVKKWNVFLFHFSFLVILLGASVTRFVGYEGSMHIREGETENRIISRESYVQAIIRSGEEKFDFQKPILLSELSKNDFTKFVDFNDAMMKVSLVEYYPNAVYEFVEDEKIGETYLDLMVSGGSKGKNIKLREGDFFETEDIVLNFGSEIRKEDRPNKEIVEISKVGDKLVMSNPIELKTLDMETKKTGVLNPLTSNELKRRKLYQSEKTSFVMKEVMNKVVKRVVSKKVKGAKNRKEDAIELSVEYKGEERRTVVFGSQGSIGYSKKVRFKDNVEVEVSYGSIVKELPFYLRLEDFKLDRYPGSMSPSAYSSDVKLIDVENKVNFDFKIYMNHILDYKNFRFFQSSYDRDEKGTILSVNKDPGTIPTYIGYLMLAIGMFAALFMPNGRFKKLVKQGRKYAKQRDSLVATLMVASFVMFSPGNLQAGEVDDNLKIVNSFDKGHAEKFGKLIIQDSAGRMKPLNTLNVEIVNKIRGGVVKGMTADQMVLGMMVRPGVWRDIDLIKIKHKGINELLGVDVNKKYIPFTKFLRSPLTFEGYKLEDAIATAIQKDPSDRNKFDKEVIKVDERFNISYMIFTGSVFKLYPKPNDIANKWYDTIGALESFNKEDSLKVRNAAVAYFMGIEKSLETNDWNYANKSIEKISEYQKKYGVDVYPSDTKIEAEIFYNKYNIFEKLMPYYLVMGLILLILSFMKILKPKLRLKMVINMSSLGLVVFFVMHTAGLITRWYISGHAPWSNGYESMIYIAWATVLAGLIFSRQSIITLASTGILAGVILFVAHLNWMDPQVTNLVPVLKSYWLSIHVSMITASYGFLALGALLGFISLILFAIINEGNNKRINLSILELNSINEMSLIIGLVLLSVGNFLGGVWANESWGRYWGWDPKETWALVSILLYAVVIHMRFIKSLYTPFNYALASVLVFSSIIMTYFGVNYYLAGMHSYAKGDPVPVPDFVPWTYFVIFVIAMIGYRNRKRFPSLSWVKQGVMARSSRPGYPSINGATKKELKKEVKKWKKMKIKSIICLLSEEEMNENYKVVDGDLVGYYEKQGFEVFNVRIEDYQKPPVNDNDLKMIEEQYNKMEKPVLVHCAAGQNRTGQVVKYLAKEKNS